MQFAEKPNKLYCELIKKYLIICIPIIYTIFYFIPLFFRETTRIQPLFQDEFISDIFRDFLVVGLSISSFKIFELIKDYLMNGSSVLQLMYTTSYLCSLFLSNVSFVILFFFISYHENIRISLCIILVTQMLIFTCMINTIQFNLLSVVEFILYQSSLLILSIANILLMLRLQANSIGYTIGYIILSIIIIFEHTFIVLFRYWKNNEESLKYSWFINSIPFLLLIKLISDSIISSKMTLVTPELILLSNYLYLMLLFLIYANISHENTMNCYFQLKVSFKILVCFYFYHYFCFVAFRKLWN